MENEIIEPVSLIFEQRGLVWEYCDKLHRQNLSSFVTYNNVSSEEWEYVGLCSAHLYSENKIIFVTMIAALLSFCAVSVVQRWKIFQCDTKKYLTVTPGNISISPHRWAAELVQVLGQIKTKIWQENYSKLFTNCSWDITSQTTNSSNISF